MPKQTPFINYSPNSDQASFLAVSINNIKAIGIINSVYWAYLNESSFLRSTPHETEWFHVPETAQCEHLALSPHKIRKARNFLINHGLLETKKAGVPARVYYKMIRREK